MPPLFTSRVGSSSRCALRCGSSRCSASRLAGASANSSCPADATVADAWQALAAQTPALAAQREHVRFARNREYVGADQPLSDGDELAFIPPVAGGTDSYLRLEINRDPISDELLGQLRHEVPTTADGAYVMFQGRRESRPALRRQVRRPRPPGIPASTWRDSNTRSSTRWRSTCCAAIALRNRAALRRYSTRDRPSQGTVPLGETSVVVCAASAHRGAAFDAARYGIEQLKAPCSNLEE